MPFGGKPNASSPARMSLGAAAIRDVERGFLVHDKGGGLTFVLGNGGVVVVPDAEIDHQIVRHVEVVLKEEADVVVLLMQQGPTPGEVELPGPAPTESQPESPR